MQRTIDNLGRLVIPVEYRNAIGVKNNGVVNIKLNNDKIIITNAKNDDRIERIKNKLAEVKKLHDNAIALDEKNIYNGYMLALNWLLEEK